jgi:phosphoribosylanthranilate isomerase
VILAGGLNSDNVTRAVQLVRPYAVDVSSGVEEAPGIKSATRIKEFVDAVRRADQQDPQ